MRVSLVVVVAAVAGAGCGKHPLRPGDPGLVPDAGLPPDVGGASEAANLPDERWPDVQMEPDLGPACSEPGTSCSATGCCTNGATCLPQGTDSLCLYVDPPPCDGPASSNLPGVTLAFPPDRCRFSLAEVAAGVQIRYQVVVAQGIAGVHPAHADLGHCDVPNASGLIVGFSIDGSGQGYCLCDQGPCSNQSYATAPSAGSYDVQIAWDGRNWNGPSDYPHPKGAPFPPGTYTLTLRATGTWDGAAGGGADAGAGYEITAVRYITITP
jgi:hypothetical protein